MKLKNWISLLLFGKGVYDNYILLILTLYFTFNYILHFFLVF